MNNDRKLEKLVELFGGVCGRNILKGKVAKNKIMRSARCGIVREMNIMMDGQMLEEVEVFKYLESLVTVVGEVQVKVQQRVLDVSK